MNDPVVPFKHFNLIVRSFSDDLWHQLGRVAVVGHHQSRVIGGSTFGRIFKVARRHAQEDPLLTDGLLRFDTLRKNYQQILKRYG